ncbi:hypothetical protein [Nocardioides sp. zg-1228]|uniref:hypothetical protein n=1 Tax=Nocardioides sp. zg-1228 TaxID=2763008 RepID=UPI0016424F75|nr:hypothetical protein [Nocardioides sp. zg-1228]MBC2932752.1 hypothetical protein [Nocardioides sp. zg-1228]QSF58226.1 hypothetical protein JX575_03190 [Nocardioides sp. zg-1228]
MHDLRRLAIGLAVAAPFLLGAAAGTDDTDRSRAAFRFADPEVVESSGLVVLPAGRGSLAVTTNDSGDSGRVFAVDPATGETVGVTSWDRDPTDVEALAPAGPGHVWVADIGDNRRARDHVEILRVPVGPGDVEAEPVAHRLVYADGAQDAEALVRHPLSGRLFVISKGVFSGTVHAAPRRLRADRSHRLTAVADAPGLVTDAVFLPGGGGVVARTYTHAYLMAYPSWQVVASWPLPVQDQGEGISIDGRELLLSTEGAGSEVLAVALPRVADAVELHAPVWTGLRLLATAYALPL